MKYVDLVKRKVYTFFFTVGSYIFILPSYFSCVHLYKFQNLICYSLSYANFEINSTILAQHIYIYIYCLLHIFAEKSSQESSQFLKNKRQKVETKKKNRVKAGSTLSSSSIQAYSGFTSGRFFVECICQAVTIFFVLSRTRVNGYWARRTPAGVQKDGASMKNGGSTVADRRPTNYQVEIDDTGRNGKHGI